MQVPALHLDAEDARCLGFELDRDDGLDSVLVLGLVPIKAFSSSTPLEQLLCQLSKSSFLFLKMYSSWQRGAEKEQRTNKLTHLQYRGDVK